MTVFAPAPMLATPPPGWTEQAVRDLSGPAATDALAGAIAPLLRAGDTVLLQGDLGAGKSQFARTLIRARLGDAAVEVPSPTFTLVQTYDMPEAEIWHVDLYRLGDPQEIWELGLDTAMETAICLVEWPDRIAPGWPGTAVCLRLEAPRDAPDAPDTRRVRLLAPSGQDLARRLRPLVAQA